MGAKGASSAVAKDGLNSEEARALGDACVEAIEYLLGCDVRRTDVVPRALFEASLEGMRLAAATLAVNPDPADLPRLARWSTLIERVERPAPSHSGLGGETLAALVSVSDELDEGVREAVESGHVSLRASLAYALRAGGPASIALLRILAADADRTVHAAARKHLAAVEEVAWWRGKFSRDPLSLLSPHDQKTAGPALAALNEALGSSEHEGYWERVRAAVDALPAALAIDFLAHRLERNRDHDPGALTMLGALLWRPNTEDVIWKLCQSWEKSSWLGIKLYRSARGSPRLEAGSVEHRTAQCASLARRAFALDSPSGRAGAKPLASLREFVASIVVQQWPLGADPTPLVEALLQRGSTGADESSEGDDSEFDHARSIVLNFLADEVPAGSFPEALVERAVSAHLQGYPRPWTGLASLGHAIVAALPVARRRVLAQRILAEGPDREGGLEWALELLSGDGYDEALDGPRAQLARAWIAVPALRSAVLDSQPVEDRLLPFVREEMLLQGKLSYDEARSVARSVRYLFGEGAFDGEPEIDDEDDADDADEDVAAVVAAARDPGVLGARAKRLAALGPWLTSGGRVGPLGDDEVARMRELRDREPGRCLPAVAKPSPVRLARELTKYFDACPGRTSRWTAEEVSVADEWFALHQRDRALGDYAHFGFVRALEAADRPQDLRWFEAYFAQHDHDFASKGRKAYLRFCARVNLAPDRRVYDPELRPARPGVERGRDEDDEDDGEDE